MELIDKYGIPLALLAALGMAAHHFVRWFKPWADRVLSAIVAFVVSAQETNESNAKAIQENQKILARNTASLERMESAVVSLATIEKERHEEGS